MSNNPIKIRIIKKIENLIMCFFAQGSTLPPAAEYWAAKPINANRIIINRKKNLFF